MESPICDERLSMLTFVWQEENVAKKMAGINKLIVFIRKFNWLYPLIPAILKMFRKLQNRTIEEKFKTYKSGDYKEP